MCDRGESLIPFKSLASWKAWWSKGEVAQQIASAICHYVDTTKLPGGGKLMELALSTKITEADFKKPHVSQLPEALIHAYPADKDPSGYLLGDAVLHVDERWGHVVLGAPPGNPMTEKVRRDRALKEGAQLKLLLAYVRSRSARTLEARDPNLKYLKELCADKKDGGSRQGTPSPAPSTHSTASATTLIMGETGESPQSSAGSSSQQLINPHVVAICFSLLQIQHLPRQGAISEGTTDVVGRTLECLGFLAVPKAWMSVLPGFIRTPHAVEISWREPRPVFNMTSSIRSFQQRCRCIQP